MNKTELTKVVNESTEGLTKEEINLVVTATLNAITDALANGEKIIISGLGTFDIKERKAYYTKDVHNENRLKYIPPMSTIHFRPSRSLKDRLNSKGDR